MPLPKNRSQSARRVARRTPSGRLALHYKNATKAWIKCRLCGVILGGVKDSRSVAKSKKIPSRIFAGQLCSGCVSKIVKARTRIRVGEAKVEDYPHSLTAFIPTVKKA